MPREIIHHICMLSGFIIGSFIEILIYFGLPFPKLTEYIFTCLAFLIQTYLMANHLHGNQSLNLNLNFSDKKSILRFLFS